MLSFLVYEGKVAVALLVFYLFYRFLLKKETFHRFNRVVLVGTAVLSFLLPLCIITIRKPLEMAPAGYSGPMEAENELAGLTPVAESVVSAPWWPTVLGVLFFTGVAFVLLRVLISILSIFRIVRQSECVLEEDGCKILVTERDIDPFSWVRYTVLSRKDWQGEPAPILLHEQAHIRYGHSAELLLVDLLSAFQWFNPAIWMLRADLRELHEYEADDAVLRSGVNLKDYQYLLIRKAVGKSGYSVANSFNHSILKNRITMMSKSKSPLWRGLRVLWLLPPVCLGIGLQAHTVYVPTDKGSEKNAAKETIQQEEPSVVLHVAADGTVDKDIRSLQIPVPATTVIISADAKTPMHAIDALKNEMRAVMALKVVYARPNTTSGVARRLPPLTDFEGKPIESPYDLRKFPEDIREHLMVVRINSADKVFFGNAACRDDAKMLTLGKQFLLANGRRSVISLKYDKGTSYGAYQHMQEILRQVYDEVRDERAREQYGKSLSALSETELDDIYKQIPVAIVE